MKKHRTLENVLKDGIDQKKYPLPDNFDYEQARMLFTLPDVESNTSSVKDVMIVYGYGCMLMIG